MAQRRTRQSNSVQPLKYEMTKRKENWKFLNDPLEQVFMIPPEKQSSIVVELVSKACYNNLVNVLDLSPSINLSCEPSANSIDTNISFNPIEGAADVSELNKSFNQDSKLTTDESITSDSTSSSHYESASVEFEVIEKTISKQWTGKTDTQESSDKYEVLSDFVEVEKKTAYKQELMIKHKAILLFLERPGVDAATWRVKKTKNDSELNEMTLDEMGGFLINNIAIDFCEWMRKLGGDEKSYISEDILKELFQIGMDNPASRALSIQECEKRVLYYKLADFLQVPEKSFQEILSQHLKWDSKVEKESSRMIAFGKGLPKGLRFKAPQNKTTETWLEWNQLSVEELSFADVYSTIKDLRSTKEYCRWMMSHPEHKKPQYLVNQGLFSSVTSDLEYSFIRQPSTRLAVNSDVSYAATVSTAGAGHILSPNLQELFNGNKVDKAKLNGLLPKV